MSAETISTAEREATDFAAQFASLTKERDTILDCNRQLALKVGEMQKFVDSAAEEKTARDIAAAALDLERAAHEKVASELAGARLEQESLNLQLRHALEKNAGYATEVSFLKGRCEDAEASRQELQTRLDEAGREIDSLRHERDVLNTEMRSLVEQRSSNRDFARKFAEAEKQIEALVEERRVIAAELEEARLAEQELRETAAPSIPLLNLLQARITEKPKTHSRRDVGRIPPIPTPADAGTLDEAIARCRAALDRSTHSPIEGMRQLAAEVDGMNRLAESLPGRRAVHRFGYVLGLCVGEICGSPRDIRPSGILTARRAIDVLERLSRKDNPRLPTASAIVVDRDPRDVQAVIAAMKGIEFQLFCADESRPALETLAAEHHDLILLDWQGSASILDVQSIRTMPRHQKTPIIFLAAADSEEPARAVADDVLIKPLIASEAALKSLTLVLEAQLTNAESELVV